LEIDRENAISNDEIITSRFHFIDLVSFLEKVQSRSFRT